MTLKKAEKKQKEQEQKIGFVVGDNFVGKMKVITGDGEEFDDPVTKFSVK